MPTAHLPYEPHRPDSVVEVAVAALETISTHPAFLDLVEMQLDAMVIDPEDHHDAAPWVAAVSLRVLHAAVELSSAAGHLGRLRPPV